MGYVGNQQVEGFTQRPDKQDLTGATGTSLTLTNAVSKSEDIDLFINNVRQEPGTAYSVGGDGVTVTLTGSVVATDDIYVVYNSLALQTASHPSTQGLSATTGTFSGGVTATTGTFSGAVTGASLSADNISIDGNTISSTDTNGNINLTPNGTGSVVLDGLSYPQTDGTSGQYLSTDGAGNLSFVTASSGGYTTDVDLQGAYKIIWDTDGDTQMYSTTDDDIRIKLAGNEKFRFYTSSGYMHAGNINGPGQSTNCVSLYGDIGSIRTCRSISAYTSCYFYNSYYVNGPAGSISHSVLTTSYNTSSDYRLKENVVDLTGAIDIVKQFVPKKFSWIVEESNEPTTYGFIAHEVGEIYPQAVVGEKDAVDENGNIDPQQMDHSKLVPILTGALKEAIAKIESLEARIAVLENA